MEKKISVGPFVGKAPCACPSEEHGCAYDEEINPDDVHICTCCDECTNLCAENI